MEQQFTSLIFCSYSDLPNVFFQFSIGNKLYTTEALSSNFEVSNKHIKTYINESAAFINL